MFLFSKKKSKKRLNDIPKHVAIIMDGNGRWAKKRGMPRFLGHRQGVKTVKRIVRRASDLGIKYLTLYAFSTENWNRPQDEVNFLMDLFVETLENEFKDLYEENVKLNFIGQLDALPQKVQDTLNRTKENSKDNDGLELILAINYGSRNEILSSIKTIASDIKSGKIKVDEIDEQMVSDNLFASHVPDPELLIRTSNEHRISNYLLWQIAYSEFIFVDALWPDFTNELFEDSLFDYQNRHRRFGGL